MIKRWTVVLMSLGLALSFVAAQAADKPAKTAKAGKIDVAKIYKAKCASCHGAKGQGNEKMAKMFKCDPKALVLAGNPDVTACAKITTDGKAKMPSFKGKLSEAEITALCEYLAKLK